MSVDIADDYRPSEDEEFMNVKQLAYFRRLLENWKSEILSGAKQTINNLQDKVGLPAGYCRPRLCRERQGA
ncbi:MAG: hypothetical protein R3B98_02965 [Hyphomonas sp.]